MLEAVDLISVVSPVWYNWNPSCNVKSIVVQKTNRPLVNIYSSPVTKPTWKKFRCSFSERSIWSRVLENFECISTACVLPISQFLPFHFSEIFWHMLFQVQAVQQITNFYWHFGFKDQSKIERSVDCPQCILGKLRQVRKTGSARENKSREERKNK